MNFWKSYGAHLLGYVAAAVGIVESIPTAKIAAIAPTLAPYVGPTGLVALFATAAGVAVHQSQATPNSPAAGVAAKLLLPALFALGLFGLGGCASLSSFLSSPTGQATVTAAVDVAVATAEQKGITAAQINGIAHQALAADQGASASLVVIASIVNAQLDKLNLPAADLAAAQVLEVALSAAITSQIGNNATLAQAQTAAADVISAVIVATGG